MRGATVTDNGQFPPAHISIHAPHAGCDSASATTSDCPILFQSTHPMRGATVRLGGPVFRAVISIHAPHAGCDVSQILCTCSTIISIHAPHAGCDRTAGEAVQRSSDFNPRTPCGVRPEAGEGAQGEESISIHAPHAGCDAEFEQRRYESVAFQSTHPMRGATAL